MMRPERTIRLIWDLLTPKLVPIRPASGQPLSADRISDIQAANIYIGMFAPIPVFAIPQKRDTATI